MRDTDRESCPSLRMRYTKESSRLSQRDCLRGETRGRRRVPWSRRGELSVESKAGASACSPASDEARTLTREGLQRDPRDGDSRSYPGAICKPAAGMAALRDGNPSVRANSLSLHRRFQDNVLSTREMDRIDKGGR